MYSLGLESDAGWEAFWITPEDEADLYVGQRRDIPYIETMVFDEDVSLTEHMALGSGLPAKTLYMACGRAYFNPIGS